MTLPTFTWSRSALYLLLAVAAAISLLPLVLVLSTAFSSPGTGVATHLVPRGFTLDNITGSIGPTNMPRLFANSAFITGASTLLVLTLGSAAAFGFVQHPFFGSNIVLLLLLAAVMLAPTTIIIPIYRQILGYGLLNNYLGLIFPYTAFGLPVAVLLFRNAFLALPRELAEAARVDGASPFRIYRRIFIPLSAPTIAAVAILQVLVCWNEYIYALIIMTDSKLATVQLAYVSFSQQFGAQYEKQFAVLALISVPVIVMFILFQRQFISGLTGGAMKE